MRRAAAALAALAALPLPAEACRLALVLALDVSSSVDAQEDRLQRSGIAAALRDPDVQAAFMASPDPVALAVFEWSGRHDQVALVPGWQMIEAPADLEAIATAIAQSPRSRSDMPTALGYALGHATILLANAPGCLFHTIDIAGDGINNEGFGPRDAYNAFPVAGVTVNALLIQQADGTQDAELTRYFREEVIRGPGAFIEIAAGYGDYARAMRRKLLAELAVQVIGGLPDAGRAARMIRLAALLTCLAAPALAECRQALALGLDVSGSVDAREYALQIQGLAGALSDPEVRDVLLGQPEAPVSIAVYEWSGPDDQSILLPWTSITDAAALSAAIATLQAAQRQEGSLTTAIGSALQTGFALLNQKGDCLTLTLDISGDGPSNTGPRPQDVAQPGPRPITVNGLVIGTSGTNGDARLAEIKELSSYYRAYVIRGLGAFVETALGFEDYETAMRRKLLRELTSLAIGSGPDPLSPQDPPAALPVLRVSGD